jgi:endonuclease/exonuclease/phosphatase family metal-dependent hydrolase
MALLFAILVALLATPLQAELRVMSLNAENLNAPCAEGSPQCARERHAYHVKVLRIARIVDLARPAYLLLVEVDGDKVAKDLNARLMQPFSYHFCTAEPKQNLCVLTSLRVLSQKIIPVAIRSTRGQSLKLRPFMRIQLLHEKLEVTILNVHFPAAYHPREYREEALIALTHAALQGSSPTTFTLALGDFNIPTKEFAKFFPHPYWQALGDPRERGSYRHAKSWQLLDNVLVFKSQMMHLDSWKFDVFRPFAFQRTNEGYPKSFDPKSMEGLSDHFPVIACMRIKKPARSRLIFSLKRKS